MVEKEKVAGDGGDRSGGCWRWLSMWSYLLSLFMADGGYF